MEERLQKIIAQSGLCSRRQAEELILEGKVKVNGKKAIIGQKVSPTDTIFVNGKLLEKAQDKIYIKLNKPTGYTCTNAEFEHEKNVFDLVQVKERLFVVGRLDKDSQGLVLLTNDGPLCQKLTHPKYEHKKVYIVDIQEPKKFVSAQEIMKEFLKGIDIGENEIARIKDIKHINKNQYQIEMAEGKKRQIRRMFEHFGIEVVKLERVKIGPLMLGILKLGQYKPLTKEELNKLKGA